MKPGDVRFSNKPFKLLIYSSPDKIDDYDHLLGTLNPESPCMILEILKGKGPVKKLVVIRLASVDGLSGWTYRHRAEHFLGFAKKNECRTKKKS